MWAHLTECRKFYIKNYSSAQPFCPTQPVAEKMQTDAGLFPGFFQGSQDLNMPTAEAAPTSVNTKAGKPG